MLTVGTEWLVEASGCDAAALRDVACLRAVLGLVIKELELSVVGEQHWHKFPGEGGATGLVMLTESHLACHTYPEFRVATFNLYCCRERPAWAWDERLREMLGASEVFVRSITRATHATSPVASESSSPAVASEGSPFAVGSESSSPAVEGSSHTVARRGEA
ncbi:MAG: S-adenosylmethionine decarboxylase [Acidobacteriota bacterium]|jgi:S-adenosylmethionine decarboxylase|nr:S-adenosylmethionine decarboxylase [Acidobacteriota bacterium]